MTATKAEARAIHDAALALAGAAARMEAPDLSRQDHEAAMTAYGLSYEKLRSAISAVSEPGWALGIGGPSNVG